MTRLSTDPIDLQLDPATGDLAVGGGLALSRGLAGVVQAARIGMQLIAGEWFLDLDLGVPWFERDGVPAARAIFGQKFNEAKLTRELGAVLAQTPSIVSVTQLTVKFSAATRAVTVVWSARTSFGDTPIDTLALGT